MVDCEGATILANAMCHHDAQRRRRREDAHHLAEFLRAEPAREQLDPGGIVGAGEERERARQPERRVFVDRADARVGMGRAHERRMRHARQHEVVAVAAAAGDEAQILLAPHRLADAVTGRRRTDDRGRMKRSCDLSSVVRPLSSATPTRLPETA